MQEKRTLKHISEDEIREIVANSSNWSECCRKLGLPQMTGTQTHFKNKCVKMGLDFSHFHRKTKSNRNSKIRPIEDYLSNLITIESNRLKKRLIKEKLKAHACEICGLDEWLGGEPPLELDHKDSNHLNNNLENLQIICANCHFIVTRQRRVSRKQNSIKPKIKRLRNNSSEFRTKEKIRKAKYNESCKTIFKIDWPPNDELAKLLWEIPTKILAERLGVSDSAIGKRCKKLGIQKPPVGYWVKLEFGHEVPLAPKLDVDKLW